MNYSSDLFLKELKDTNKHRVVISKKNKKAYSDGDVQDLADELLTVAENLSEFYNKKDPKGAIEAARKQWVRQQQDDNFHMGREAAKIAEKELIKEWKREGHI